MRWIIALLATMSIFVATAAFASSAYDDVPTDHWAYNALDYLTQRGVLEGYPDGFFKGDRTLTRYEFAQAVARLLDTIQAGNVEEQIKIMADTLRAEFSDQLAELSKQIDALGGQVNGLDSAVSDLQGTVDSHGSRLDAIEGKLGCMNAGADWNGTFRYRWQFDQQGDNDRFRQRVGFTLGYNKQVNEETLFGFRFRTGTGAVLSTPTFTAGSKGGASSDIYLDRAYVKYSPSWFGYYTDENCNECTSRLDIYAGLYPNITQDPDEVILDADVNLQGAAVVYHFNKDFQILEAMSVFVENNTGEFDDDSVLFATELYHKNLIWCGFDAWLGCYGWRNENGLADAYFADNMLPGFDFNNNGTVGDKGDRFSTEYTTVKAGAQYTFNCVWNKPLAVWGEYFVNIDSDAEDRINAVNAFITPDIIYESTDDTGFAVGAQWGEAPTCKGDWNAFARYKEVGANAVVDGVSELNGPDAGANTNDFKIGFNYACHENSMFTVTYFLTKMHNAFGFAIPASEDDWSTVAVDWTFKF